MCGISGILARRSPAELHSTISRMNLSLSHRGPDMSDEWVDGDAHIALGHRRLSILDLSPEGLQPMASASGRYVITFNGEIYNHRGMRAELAAKGHRFRGSSDTEVLLAAIEERGLVEAIRECAGMFAFAVWDRELRELHLVRDRLGKKPLYYGWHNGQFLFASELKAFMEVADVGMAIDRSALASYLRYQYVRAPQSILSGIRKLPQGTHLRVTIEAVGEPEPYWSIEEAAFEGLAAPRPGSDETLLDELEQLIRSAVRTRMVADVPVGAFLSGGIDSSLISALMQQEADRPISTFTVGFEEPEFDESPHAEAVASAIGANHHAVRLRADDFLDTVPALPELYDEPFADPSAIPLFHIARFARQYVTVCLSGDGGDEMFAGYGRYRIAGRLGAIPPLLRSMIAGGIDTIPAKIWNLALSRLQISAGSDLRGELSGDRIQKLAVLLRSESLERLYRSLTSVHDEPERFVLDGTEALEPAPRALHDPLRQMMLIDSCRYLPDDILVKLDRATMAVGLEARAPLLDHRVVEWAWHLSTRKMLRDGRGKWPLRALFGRHLPAELAERPKRGFSVPIADWLRGPLRGWAEALIDPELLRADGLLDPEPIERLWTEHLSGSRNWSFQLWTILTFQNWIGHWRGSLTAASRPSLAA